MPNRTGAADLPLHGGRAPRWLFERMASLAPAVVEAIVVEEGPEAVLERLSDPWWFQAFGCVLGFDWHSSGVTTTVYGALKAGLAGTAADTGIRVAGGKGRASRRTPSELAAIGEDTGLDGEALAYNSRTAAKVDSATLQDGFPLYHHASFVTESGAWAVVDRATVLSMPTRHAVDVAADVDPRRLKRILLSTWEAQPADFERVLGISGVGARSVRALSLVAELLYGERASVRDPARFSFAHGGKDGHPYPVDRDTFDRSIEFLRDALGRAKVGRSDRLSALRRLASWEAAPAEAGSR